ncbi:MAG: DnaB-like helicase C-terminal domain-containing protein [Bacteroides sp.]
MQKAEDIKNIESEAGVIATVLLHPEYIYSSEQLKPNHFSEESNGYLYWAISELTKRGVEKIDAFGITNILNSKTATQKWTDILTIPALNELIELSPIIARNTVTGYKVLVDSVLNAAFRRDTHKKLRECEAMCVSDEDSLTIQSRIYNEIEDIICRYQNIDLLMPLSTRVDEIWGKIRKGQNSDNFIPFCFPTLNRYAKISRTDAIVIAAKEKRGKSLMLLNWAVDLMKKGKKVLVIDTELDTPLYLMRLLAHLSGVEFAKIRDGSYSDEEERLIAGALDVVRSWDTDFCHIYMPVIDDDKLISVTKKYLHTYGLDVVVLDYLKGNTNYFLDAYQNSAALGKTTDTLKNYIAGELGLYVLTAVQCTSTGAIADSAKIIRNCSTLLYLERKTPSEIEADGGLEYGNMKLNVRANRNGEIHGEDEYISLTFDGNRCLFKESKQPKRIEAY